LFYNHLTNDQLAFEGQQMTSLAKNERRKAAPRPLAEDPARARKSPPHGSLSSWGFKVANMSTADLIHMLRDGVDARFTIYVTKHYNIPQSNLARVLGTSEATLIRKIKAKAKLGPLESERLTRIAMIEAAAEQAFGDAEIAKEWMTTENMAFGETPLSFLDTEAGAREVRKVLNAIAYGASA
jgi:putative toxin-antitoxin system antitoxin component (TIGR02293 family)